MGQRVSFSFRDDESDLYQWVEQKYKEGRFRTRTDVIIWALAEAKKRDKGEKDRAEWKT